MHIGIVGLPNAGKTTVFNALTGGSAETAAFSAGRFSVEHAMVEVPDPRFDRLVELYQPRKVTRARVEYHDIAGLDKGMSEGGLSGDVLNAIAQNDALLHVVRGFEDDEVLHSEGDVDPARDLVLLESEFLLSDLVIAERRVERLRASLSKGGKSDERKAWEAELPLLERILASLEEEVPVRDLELKPEEEKMIRGYQFLSAKPVLVLLNTGEAVVADPESVLPSPHRKTKVAALQGKLEMELAQMDAEDREIFLEEYEIAEAGLDRVIRLSYALLGLQCFFTAGESEVRAWTIPSDATALDAAGTIHSDLARGFIRAETVAYQDLLEAGSMSAARQAGTLRLEGRDYRVADGDVMEIRFNV